MHSEQLKKLKITCNFFHILIAYRNFCIKYSSLKVNYTIGYIHFTNITKVMMSYSVLDRFVHGTYIQIALWEKVLICPIFAVKSCREI